MTLIAIAAEAELAERRAQLGQLAEWLRHYSIETREMAVPRRSRAGFERDRQLASGLAPPAATASFIHIVHGARLLDAGQGGANPGP